MRGRQISPASMRWRTLLAAAALLVIGILVGRLRAGIEAETATIVGAREPWSEPQSQSKDPSAALARLVQHPLWRIEPRINAVAEARPAPPPQWRLAGVIADRDRPSAVIVVEKQGNSGGALQYRQVGDSLPDGARLVAISDTSITVEAGGIQKQIKLLAGR